MNTPEHITELLPNEIFVFGSNYAGRHGRGAAEIAARNFGAINGVGQGLMGECYGIATKDQSLRVLPLHAIRVGVEKFLRCADDCPHFRFLVTPIGCGLAGYSPKDIAPLFERALHIGNVVLPASFTAILLAK